MATRTVDLGSVIGPQGPQGVAGAKGATGQRGTRWKTGTAITGTSTAAKVFSGSGISDALSGDMYLNTSYSYVYECVTGGAAGTATWKYICSIRGYSGSDGDEGQRGSQWLTGTLLSGTSSTTGAYSSASMPYSLVGDMYLNTSYGYVYQCTTAGTGSAAKWTYKGSIRGAAGSMVSTASTGTDYTTQRVRNVAMSTADLTAGSSSLLSGNIYLVYE